mmetsp:Transcript_11068/g.16825  ORF Transcript_11068/g.16825 Transcript_11068/m.16825 type:complete len:137 (-) Transcript_11068:141-551(-)
MFYFLAFIKIVLSVLVLQILLLVAQILLLNFPFHLFILVSFHKYILPNSVNVEAYPQHMDHLKMVPMPSNKASLFSKLAENFNKVIKISSPMKVIKSVLKGNNLISIMLGLLKTLEREDATLGDHPTTKRYDYWKE